MTQGRIADRTHERLGTIDKGVIMLRRQYFEQMERVRRSEDPIGVYTRPRFRPHHRVSAGTREVRRRREVHPGLPHRAARALQPPTRRARASLCRGRHRAAARRGYPARLPLTRRRAHPIASSVQRRPSDDGINPPSKSGRSAGRSSPKRAKFAMFRSSSSAAWEKAEKGFWCAEESSSSASGASCADPATSRRRTPLWRSRAPRSGGSCAPPRSTTPPRRSRHRRRAADRRNFETPCDSAARTPRSNAPRPSSRPRSVLIDRAACSAEYVARCTPDENRGSMKQAASPTSVRPGAQ